MSSDDGLYGIAAAFDSPETLRRAAEAARKAGYSRLSAHTPFPVEGMAELCGFRFNYLPFLVVLGGFGGAGAGYFMQWYSCVVSYPLNVAGRPLHSWPSFIPITFELGVLGASFTAIGAFLALSGLPCPYHPIFHAPSVTRGMTRGAFVLCIEARDPAFERGKTRRFLESLDPQEVDDVPA